MTVLMLHCFFYSQSWSVSCHHFTLLKLHTLLVNV